MNQILYINSINKSKIKRKNKLIIIIICSLISIITLTIYYSFKKITLIQNENFSKSLISNYDVITLYSNNDNYNNYNNYNNYTNYTIYEKEKLLNSNNHDPFVIGLIQIDKINLTYPILSSVNKELLKISPCRFARTTSK